MSNEELENKKEMIASLDGIDLDKFDIILNNAVGLDSTSKRELHDAVKKRRKQLLDTFSVRVEHGEIDSDKF